MRTDDLKPTKLPDALRETQRLLFIAKHAKWTGGLHPEDGNHALYHRETREILEALGMPLVVADSYTDLFAAPEADFVFPLLNRGGFFNSEMLLPLLCNRLGLPYVGASPIVRGLSDDKHLTKLEAAARGVPTAPWALFRRGAPVDVSRCPPARRWVVKPNNSSASWGIRDAHDRAELAQAIAEVQALDHDALVEPFIDGSDVEVPVITLGGEPAMLPMMIFEQADPTHLRTYQEKRDLVDRSAKYSLRLLEASPVAARIEELTRRMVEIFRPFDYGRFEFRVDFASGDIRLLEVNLNCNLWSEKVFGRAALAAGFSQADLIETIVAESMIRQVGAAGRRKDAA
ncbi:D-alanine--D-alanine ligase family protein [Sphingopyxis indica]|uniref:D-alanine-D-alanine ligase n=1 Tax=Sphingopyxis indica TaxID=436663 RepID=A0A239FWW6_9SPHN|nr:phosphoribosylglycinamide synthetase [Sphingopyxis indica]WOF44520.1 phosphoribosylglycinamide synthetase [Sphingopyxis indica]SNS60712.1 D-alanine-D-alanine ligase [Sphingopyxis indica]